MYCFIGVRLNCTISDQVTSFNTQIYYCLSFNLTVKRIVYSHSILLSLVYDFFFFAALRGQNNVSNLQDVSTAVPL